MSSFAETVTGWAGHVMRFGAMLLLFFQLYVMIEAFRLRRSAGCRVFACVQTAVGLLFFSGLLDGTFREDYLPFARSYPAFVSAIYDAPWLVAALLLLALILVCAGSLLSDRKFKRTHIFDDAIKQTVDLLPEGICFGDENGTAVFFNVKMDDWCRALTGAPLKSARLLREFVTAHGETRGESRIALTPDGTALLFSFRRIEVGSRSYEQLIASDISRTYRIITELRRHNASLRDIRERMREFSGRAAELAMAQELLKARVTVHDEIGHVLLRIKYYLDDPVTTDEKNLIALIRTMNDLLISDAEDAANHPEGSFSALGQAEAAAGEIGVRVELHGAPPEDAAFCAILARAIRECAVNAVKHAGGSVLRVELGVSGDEMSAVLSNDGAPPAGEIRESGGLASLRLMVERAGGSMGTQSAPQFRLTIRKPLQR